MLRKVHALAREGWRHLSEPGVGCAGMASADSPTPRHEGARPDHFYATPGLVNIP